MSSLSFRRLACAPVALALSVALVACSSKEEPTPEPTPSSTPATTSTQTSTEETTTGSSEGSSTATSTSSKRRRDDAQVVEDVREKFASLAPESLFDDLDTCVETSLKGSYDCSGSTVGQLQFFASKSMAEDTADVLTGLSSSRVVEKTDEKLVGWSMLGKTAVITVVDKKEGKVLQQMVASDVDDPEQRIFMLGLADSYSEPTDESSTATTTAVKKAPR